MVTRRTLSVVLCGVVATGALTACGGSGTGKPESKPSPVPSASDAERMTEALEIFRGYRSYGLKGEVRDDVGTRIDLHVDRRGNCAGSYETLGNTTRFVMVGNQAWEAYDEGGLSSFVELAKLTNPEAVASTEAAVEKARGKYVEWSARELKNALALSLCGTDRAYEELPDSVTTAERGNGGTKDGVRLISLTHPEEDGEVVVQVPETGTPTPRHIEFEIGDVPVLVDIDDPNMPFEAEPPAPSAVVSADDARGLELSIE
ncbi:hypothetical protein [Streptomyces sp. NPDC060184]|uniref:hypothetical protein n=1 Tax=Streptomyces sp. NPDC060184 TaxID=3347064 RepID=UPI00365084EE